jgi:adenosylcobyric acid synthase
MNPILIKPEADSRSQVVVMGRPWKTLDAREYYLKKQFFWKQVTAALDRLRAQYELVIIEGAGSAAELNLRDGDIVNMAVARYANAPILLAGDIDRGGIFAQLIGTVWLLEPEERDLVQGLIVNKFRGDISLFTDGVRILEDKSKTPVLGVVPYLQTLYLPEEDAVALETPSTRPRPRSGTIEIVIIHLPRIANFDDFDALNAEPGVQVRYVDHPEQIQSPAAIILPGTKSTLNDLAWMRSAGFIEVIQQYARNGGAVVGICGGYQMLGEAIHDPAHVESKLDSAPGLGLLPIGTVFAGDKATHQAQAHVHNGPGWLAKLEGQTVTGYEIHMGRTQSPSPWLEITERNGQPVHIPDGAVSENGKIWGCYIHGLFANEKFRLAWLAELGWSPTQPGAGSTLFADSLTRLANTLEGTLNMNLLEKIIWEG